MSLLRTQNLLTNELTATQVNCTMTKLKFFESFARKFLESIEHRPHHLNSILAGIVGTCVPVAPATPYSHHLVIALNYFTEKSTKLIRNQCMLTLGLVSTILEGWLFRNITTAFDTHFLSHSLAFRLTLLLPLPLPLPFTCNHSHLKVMVCLTLCTNVRSNAKLCTHFNIYNKLMHRIPHRVASTHSRLCRFSCVA